MLFLSKCIFLMIAHWRAFYYFESSYKQHQFTIDKCPTNSNIFHFSIIILGPAEPVQYGKTQRGRRMLVFEGYRYVENRQSAKNIFWRCSRYVKYGCRATVSTSKDPYKMTIRVTGTAHSHSRESKCSDNLDYKLI